MPTTRNRDHRDLGVNRVRSIGQRDRSGHGETAAVTERWRARAVVVRELGEVLAWSCVVMGTFIPAARFGVLTPFYDALCRILGLGARLREFEMAVLPRELPAAVLEVGCGTGELTLRLTRSLRSRVTAMDVDAGILALAERKLRGASAPASLVVARAEALPFRDGSFDLVIASLVVHHLRTEEKRAAFREWRRVLRHDGIALLVDFGRPVSRLGGALTTPLRWNLLEETGDHFAGRIPALLAEAGLSAEEVGSFRGVVRAWQARRARRAS